MNVMNDLYFEVDPKRKEILAPPRQLELNWNNIGGLLFLDDNKLSDLSWAGYENSGFIKFTKENKDTLRCYSCGDKIIDQIKTELIKKLSEIRYNYECGGVIVNNSYMLNTDDRSKLLMQMKYLECKYNPNLMFKWKTTSGFIEFSSNDFVIIFEKIWDFIQECFDMEKKISSRISKCDKFIDLLYIDLNSINWNFNKIII
jgi:hypothetical protein